MEEAGIIANAITNNLITNYMNFEDQTRNVSNLTEPKIFDESRADSTFDFILKLANDKEKPDEEIIEAIVENLKKIEQSRNLPNMIDRLAPAAHNSETKLMTEGQKVRLDKALIRWQKGMTKS